MNKWKEHYRKKQMTEGRKIPRSVNLYKNIEDKIVNTQDPMHRITKRQAKILYDNERIYFHHFGGRRNYAISLRNSDDKTIYVLRHDKYYERLI